MNGANGITPFQPPRRVTGKAKVVSKKPVTTTQSEATVADKTVLGQTQQAPELVPKSLPPKEPQPAATPVAPSKPDNPEPVEESTNWILESANSTPFAGSEHLEHYGQRLPRYPKPIRMGFDEALLDALTSSEVKEGEGKLKDLATTMSWSLKFKKDAPGVFEKSGYEGLKAEALAFEEAQGAKKKSPLDKVLSDPKLLFKSKLPQSRVAEANSLLTQHAAGNDNPGIGSKTLGKGVCYLRGRKGTRLFYRQKGEKTEWLAVCDKSTEPKAIALLRKELDLR